MKESTRNVLLVAFLTTFFAISLPASAQEWTRGRQAIGKEMKSETVQCRPGDFAVGIRYTTIIAPGQGGGMTGIGLVCRRFGWLVRNAPTQNINDRLYLSQYASPENARPLAPASRRSETQVQRVCPPGRFGGTAVDILPDTFMQGIGIWILTNSAQANETNRLGTTINSFALACHAAKNKTGRFVDSYEGGGSVANTYVNLANPTENAGYSRCPNDQAVTSLQIRYYEIPKPVGTYGDRHILWRADGGPITQETPASVRVGCGRVPNFDIRTNTNSNNDGSFGNDQRQLKFARDIFPRMSSCLGACHDTQKTHFDNLSFPQKIWTQGNRCGVASPPAIPLNGQINPQTMLDRLKCIAGHSRTHSRPMFSTFVVPFDPENSGLLKVIEHGNYNAALKSDIRTWIIQGAYLR